MKRYRIGQEITVRWAILSSGEPRPLAGRDLKLVLHSPRYADHEIADFTTDGNVAEFSVTPDMAKMLGVYSLTLWENYGASRQRVVDSCRAFELVPTTCDVGNCHDLADGATLELCSFLDTGIKGDTGEGVPAGGAPGQVLSKASDKDFDSAWEYPAGRRTESASGQSTAEVHNESQFQCGDMLPGHNSFSEGSGFAAGAYAHAEGGSTTASGEYSHSEGLNAAATGRAGHAENRQTIASGDYSHAGGSQSEARAPLSFAHGKNAVAANEGEVVFGMNPEVDDSGDSIFQLGAGTGAAEGKRKTVFRIDKDGTIICVDPTTGAKMALQEVIKHVQQTLYDFFNDAEDADDTINKWHEVEAFLDGIKDTENLAGILAKINDTLSKKADLSQVTRTDAAQHLTANAQQTARTNISAMADTPSGDPMHYMFEQAGAVWNASTGYWELNGLTDLTTAEMRQIYTESHLSIYTIGIGEWAQSSARTNICNCRYLGGASVAYEFYYCTNMQTVKMAYGKNNCNARSIERTFYMCANLKHILTPISVTNANMSYELAFFGCAALQHVFINNLNGNLSFADSPNLAIDSGVHLINNVNTSIAGIVVTLHDDAYERFIADPTIQTALAAHTNITLASAGATVAAAAPARMMSLRSAPLQASEPEVVDGELIAPVGMFITQAADVTDSERLYFTRKTWNVDDDLSMWRAAASSERAEWQERMNAEADAMMLNTPMNV